MKYDHIVNHNGTYYLAGQEVPEDCEREAMNELPFHDSELEDAQISRKRGRPSKSRQGDVIHG